MEKTEREEKYLGVKAIWRHLKPFKKEMTLLVILGLISAIANGFVPYVSGRFFDALIDLSRGEQGNSNIPLWAFFLGLWAIIQIIAVNIDWILSRLRRSVDTRVHVNIQAEGFVHLFRLPLSFHKNAKINEILQRISNAGWRISSILTTIISIFPQLLSVLIGITLAISINPLLASILAVGVFTYLTLLIRILVPIAEMDHAAHEAWSEAWGDAAEAVHQIESVKQAAAEDYETKKTESALLKKSYNLWFKLEKVWNNINFFQGLIVFLTQLAVFVVSVELISRGVISVGELVALNGYALMFFGPFAALGYNWQTIQNGLTSAAQAEVVFREKQEEYIPAGAIAPQKFKGKIEFDTVSFRYGEGQNNVLSDLAFKVNQGEIVAIVGKSGVGKSTLISLISGYYFPSEGLVLIDGNNTRKLNLTNFRRHIAVVPQEVALFNDTIETNIRYGSFTASSEEVKLAAREAQLEEFILLLPRGYQTLVGERGVKLSVGQKQRLAIARAILRNPSILILDEPTSALDAETERFVTEALEKLMKGRTTFIIAHRLSTVRKANRIFFMEEGKIVEDGNHDKLMKIPNGKYRKMYELHIGLH